MSGKGHEEFLADLKYAALVEEYKCEFWPNTKSWLEPYLKKEFGTFGEAIRCAAMACGPGGKKHPHQWRIKKATLRVAANRLMACEAPLERATDFAALHDLVKSTTKGVRGFGDLAKYDTAVRIAAFRSLKPKRVYLHAGTKGGARAVDVSGPGPIEVSEFRERGLTRLDALQLEDFLCIYKNVLSGAVSSADRSRCWPPNDVASTCGGRPAPGAR